MGAMAENEHTPFAGRALRLTLVYVALAGLGGCATTSNMGQLEQSHSGAPIRMLVMESPMVIAQDRLHAALAPDIKAGSPAADELITKGEQHAQQYALAAMESDLDKQTGLEVISSAAESSVPLDDIRKQNFASTITQDEADRLRTATGADALLRFGITDYGLTPKAWRKGYITFEVASTLAVAGIIAYTGSTAAHAAAGAYLAQETVEETAEGYAGFRALDVVYRPVRIEAELVSLNPVATIWKSGDTGLSDARWSRLTGKVAAAERNKQLDQATDDAVKDVIADLSSANRMY